MHGNIFDSKAQTLVNTVNCVGVMGKGLAKEFKDRFPIMFKQYQQACRRKKIRSGAPFLYRELHRNILCVPTKDNWKEPSKYEFIEAGLKAIRENYEKWDIKSLAVPPLGCGLGGLDWNKVKKIIIQFLDDLPIDIEVYEPAPTNKKIDRQAKKRVVQKVNVTLPLTLVGEIVRLVRMRISEDARLGKLLMQKFAFFTQCAGAPIHLRFDKYKFGPYDHRLNYMIERLEGLYIRDYSTSWNWSDLHMLDEKAWLETIKKFKNELTTYRKAILAAIDLLANRSLEDVELLATAMYGWSRLVSSGEIGNEREVIDYIKQWSKEKQDKFDNEQISKALEILTDYGWLGPSQSETEQQVTIGQEFILNG
jgi:O-acetyl-ADP-ribose deacetylase (regulator of RNase III)/uncharacterized protein YwgA